MFTGLRSKLLAPILCVLVFLIIFIVLFVAWVTNGMVSDFTTEKMNSVSSAVTSYLSVKQQQTIMTATAVGNSMELIQHIRGNDRNAVLQYIQREKAVLEVDAIAIVDINGILIADSQSSDLLGEDLSDVTSFAAGLRGERITFFAPTPTVPMVMTGSAPITYGNEIVGSVVVSFDIGSNDYLDSISSTHGADFTIFDWDTSVATTLIHPETRSRTIGTQAASWIVERVLENGEHVSTNLRILGILPYYAYYFPIRGAENEIVGMFFVGISEVEARAATAALRRDLILTGVTGLILAGILTFIVIARALKPLGDLSALAKNVTAGKINMNLNSRNVKKDEIGSLTLDLYGMVDVLKYMVEDLNKLSYEYTKVGNVDYRIDVSKYHNTFKELMDSTNNIIDVQLSDIHPMIEAVNKMADGDFDIKIDDLPGKKMILPQSIRAIAAKLNELYAEIAGLAKEASKGNFNTHIDEEKFSGKWGELASTLNTLMKAMSEPLAEIERNVTIMSHGDFSHIEGNYPGTFGMLKDACNLVNSTTEGYVSEVTQLLEAIAGGDLTVVPKQDYIGSYAPIKTAINTILDNLNATMADINDAVDHLATGASQISENAMSLADGTTRQTASIEELSSSLALIHEKSMSANSKAETASDSTIRTGKFVATGDSAVQAMVGTMNKVKESSESIAEIIDVITNIAFQTNLLALNASVEASRAGEHGRGFAVVAEEVRNLAGRSQLSASETSSIIEEDLGIVNKGLKITSDVVDAFKTISSNIEETSQLVADISELSKDQLASISDINNSVSDITGVVTDTSTAAQESASTSRELSSHAEALREKVAFFKLRI